MSTYEPHLRQAVHLYAARAYGHDTTAVIADEVEIGRGRARADVAVVNGELHAYELKSDHDSLRRLPTQLQVYAEAFPYVWIAASDRHLNACAAASPSWIGILAVVAGADEAQLVREARPSPHWRATQMAELLWRDEIKTSLAEREALGGLRTATRSTLANHLARLLTIEELSAEVRKHLKGRLAWGRSIRKLVDDKG
jgi:hypothetical protein